MLSETMDASLKFDTCGGDVVLAGAVDDNKSPSAIDWHQDWVLPKGIIAVSVALKPISGFGAPLWIATKQSQVPCTGPPGTIIVRDVSAWHRGSLHFGKSDRALPCFRFSSLAARNTGELFSKRHRTAQRWKPHLKKFIHILNSPSDPSQLEKLPVLEDETIADPETGE